MVDANDSLLVGADFEEEPEEEKEEKDDWEPDWEPEDDGSSASVRCKWDVSSLIEFLGGKGERETELGLNREFGGFRSENGI